MKQHDPIDGARLARDLGRAYKAAGVDPIVEAVHRLRGNPPTYKPEATDGRQQTLSDVILNPPPEIDELILSTAFNDPKHPQHAAVSARVRQYFEARFGNELAV